MIVDQCFVDKGWGYEEVLINDEKYCAKILHVNRNKRMSWHYHIIKDETFYVETGRVELYWSDTDDLENAERMILLPGMTFNIPTKTRHMLVGLENSRVFEFSTRHFDHDSYRIIKGD